MKLSDAYAFDSLNRRYKELVEAREVAKSKKGLGVTINGRYQDDEMLAAINMAVVAEFDRRIKAVVVDLAQLGVEVDV